MTASFYSDPKSDAYSSPLISAVYGLMNRAAYLAGASYTGKSDISGTLERIGFHQALSSDSLWEAAAKIVDAMDGDLIARVDLFFQPHRLPSGPDYSPTLIAEGHYRLKSDEGQLARPVSLPSRIVSLLYSPTHNPFQGHQI